jgi:antitoxin component YwqK of YwqJK toxin-antitoxin module
METAEKINQTDSTGLKHGLWKWYYANGKLLYEGEYLNGKYHGLWKKYNLDGTLKSIEYYS